MDQRETLSRRGLFRRARLAAEASFLGALIPGLSDATPLAQKSAPGDSASSQSKPSALTPASMPRGWSREEIERRWQRVRAMMKQNHLDCLLVASQAEGEPDVRYLTSSNAGWAVFPIEGKVTAFFARVRQPLEITGGQKAGDLGIEIRSPRGEQEGSYSPAIIDCLRENGMAQARIGVGGLTDVFRNVEGSLNYTTYNRILQAFPMANFESAVDLLMRAKLARSAEEIAVFEKATEVGELGLQTMFETARAGVSHREVWTKVWRTLWDASGEIPRVSIAANAAGASTFARPHDEPLPAGGVLCEEITTSVLGYQIQVNHSALLGTSMAPADWASAARYCIDVFHSLVDWIAPGKTYKEFIEFYTEKQVARGTKPENVVLWTCGFGDGPRSGPGGRQEGLNLAFEAGQVFDLKPLVTMRGTQAVPVQFGDTVVVTDKGARRLGTRRLEPITLGA